ncbi:MAG: ABC transporter permease [Symbiobacteriaceae bacterium]|nr:ABC transporter permease [Symbiobacteriaceae bacterium]
MDIIESLRLAWIGIVTNKFRSFLTMLGMIIGVGSVIGMISIGEAGQAAILEQISSIGSGTITLSGGRGQMTLTLDLADYVRELCPSVTHMYPLQQTRMSIKVGSTTRSYTIIGTAPDYAAVQGWSPAVGTFINQSHLDTRMMVCVIGETIQTELFGGRMPVGETLRINGQVFEIIGVMERKGTSLGQSMDNQVFIPVSTMLRLLGTKNVQQVVFLAPNESNYLAAAEIRLALRHRWGPAAERDDPFRITSMDDLLETMNEAIGTFALLLAGIAGISLLVGGIGIMNIMLVSVTERTREIGIRKAIGAKRKDLLSQFLIEAVVISLSGGSIGLLLGIALSNLVATYAGWSQGVSPRAVMLAITFSMSIGLFFGIYPANKAARMDPIEALRYQ